jgi:hypothetical protein
MCGHHWHGLLGSGPYSQSLGRPVLGLGDSLMALTLEAEQRLDSVGLTALFDGDREAC